MHALAPAPIVRDGFSSDSAKVRISSLVADCSIEVTPTAAAKHASLAALLPAGTRVYVAFIPGEDPADVIDTAARLRAEGLAPVPHLPARSLAGEAELDHMLRRLTWEAGVEEVLVVGGGVDVPRGAFSGTAALLATGALERHGIRSVGLAGHPEGQRELDPPGAATTLAEKLDYARATCAEVHLVTQFVFEAERLLAWERAIRGPGTPPIHVGIPGPATFKSLLNYARLCGVGNAMRVLARQGGSLLKLARLTYPDALITALANHVGSDPETRIGRLHFFPFGGIARTARWLEAVREGAFTMRDDGTGFAVDPEIA